MSRPLVLRNFDFGRVWLGQILSQAGTRMYQIAIVWWLVTSSRADAGKVAALFLVITSLPAILFLNRIGRLIDSRATKNILMIADALNAAICLGVGLMLLHDPQTPIWYVYAAGFGISALQAITDPALSKAVPELVDPDDIGPATAFQTSTISFGYYLGAGLGGLLIPFLGVAGVVLFNAGSYFTSFVCALTARFHHAPPPPAAGADFGESAWRILERYPLFKKLLVGMGLANFFCVPTFLILPLYVSRALHADASTLAFIESGLWMGILCGTWVSRRVRFTENPELLGCGCVVGLAAGLIAPGLVVDARFYFAMIFLQGMSFSFMPVRFITLFQEGLRPEMKGRFFALMSAILTCALPISHFAAGALADLMPISAVCIVQGVGALLVAVYFAIPEKPEVLAWNS